MITTNVNTIELTEFTGKNNAEHSCRATFPLLGAHGLEACATVYFELEPGKRLGRHTDSAEEILLILEGTVEVTVGDETGTLGQGALAVAPKMVPHDLRNVGKGKAKVLGFFGGANNIVATFDETWLPTNSNIVDTAAASQQAGK